MYYVYVVPFTGTVFLGYYSSIRFLQLLSLHHGGVLEYGRWDPYHVYVYVQSLRTSILSILFVDAEIQYAARLECVASRRCTISHCISNVLPFVSMLGTLQSIDAWKGRTAYYHTSPYNGPARSVGIVPWWSIDGHAQFDHSSPFPVSSLALFS